MENDYFFGFPVGFSGVLLCAGFLESVFFPSGFFGSVFFVSGFFFTSTMWLSHPLIHARVLYWDDNEAGHMLPPGYLGAEVPDEGILSSRFPVCGRQ